VVETVQQTAGEEGRRERYGLTSHQRASAGLGYSALGSSGVPDKAEASTQRRPQRPRQHLSHEFTDVYCDT
jgi:hypothetical protein